MRHTRSDSIHITRFDLSSRLPAAEPTADANRSVGSSPDDRRKRRRRPTRLPGWLYVGEQVAEVEMRNVSPDGAGFVAPDALRKGESIHLKIGMGPARRPRAAQVMYCKPRGDGRFDIGIRFDARLGD